VSEKPGITAGLPPPDDLHLAMPALVIVGVNDELVDPSEARAWAEGVGAQLVEMKGANHFFWAKYDTLTKAVCDFLDRVL
jgi:alpha/beta superfamily hydrolase